MRMTRTIALLFIASLWGIAGFATAELTVRRLINPPRQVVTADAELGWRFLRNLRLPGMRTNASGFRDVDHDEVKTPGTYRVLVLGDSYVAGAAVAENATFTALLESRLRAAGRNVEVINAGIPAWSTDQELRYYLLEGYRYHADLVLLAAVPNDLRENVGKAFRDGGPPLRPTLRDRALWLALNYSAIAGWLGELYGFNDSFLILQRTYAFSFPLGGRICDDYDLLHEPPAPPVLAARTMFEGLVQSLHAATQARGSLLAVTALPIKLEFLGPTPFHALVLPGLFSRYVRDFAGRERVPFVNLFTPLRRQPRPLAFFQENEFHFNEAGHRFVADQLASWILARLKALR